MKKLLISLVIPSVLIAFSSSTVFAHGGKLDKNGCHMEKKTGKRHCHKKPSKKK